MPSYLKYTNPHYIWALMYFVLEVPQSEIARTFGVSRAAVSLGVQRIEPSDVYSVTPEEAIDIVEGYIELRKDELNEHSAD